MMVGVGPYLGPGLRCSHRDGSDGVAVAADLSGGGAVVK